MRPARFFSLAAAALAACASTQTPAPTKTVKRWDSGFVTVENGQFIRNGEPFTFVGTNAYWLASLNTDADINDTLHNISAAGIKVVRTWAFNDVDVIPENGTWFQLIQNGSTFINTGVNGLQRLDKVVQFAEEAGVLLIMSLTNNWNPRPLIDNTTVSPVDGLRRRDVTVGTNNSLPRNFLSNDFGGIDAYVREFGIRREHDEFFQNSTIINIFQNFTDQIVNRYKNSSAILAWELANDPRCNSSIPNAASCNTATVTGWHATVANHVRSVDPNHIVSSGAHGFMCINSDCPKLFPLAPKPTVSATPGKRKRAVKPLTMARVVKEHTERLKKTREVQKNRLLTSGEGIRIRGRWIATRQVNPSGGAMTSLDGSSGVDSQDILNIPNIGFGSFQLFPDQNVYFPPDPNLPAFNNTVNAGVQWIQLQAQAAQLVGKPTIMNGFGLVTQNNAPFFVPFNSTIAPFNGTGTSTTATTSSAASATPTIIGGAAGSPGSAGFGVSNAQQDDAYTQWVTAAAQNGVAGAVQYQWGQGNLTATPGTTVSPNNDASSVSPNDNTSGTSPNDGYQSAPTDSDGVASVLTSLTSLFHGGI